METYRVDVGRGHGVQPKNIVGAIANEADIDSKFIGRIEIFDDHSLVDLPEGMPKELLSQLRKVRVVGQRLNLSLLGGKRKPARDRPAATESRATKAKPKARHRDTKNKGKPRRTRRTGA